MADDITIKIGVDGKAVAPALKEVEKQAEKTGKQVADKTTKPAEFSLKKLRAQAAQFGADIVGRFVSAFGALALFDKGLQKSAEYMERLSNISTESKRLGMGAEDYQRLGRAAELSGVGIEVMAKAMEEIRELQAQAVNGNEKAIQSLVRLGYTEDQARSGKAKMEEVLMKVSSRYRQATTEAERYGIAVEYLGKKAADNAGPLLGMSPALMVTAMGSQVTSQAEADRQAVLKRQREREDREGGIGKMMDTLYDIFISDVQIYRTKFGQQGSETTRAAFESMGFEYGLEELAARIKNPNTTQQERTDLEQEMVRRFSKMAEDFRYGYTGATVDGVAVTSEMVERELNRKLSVLMPGYTATAEGFKPISPAAETVGKAGLAQAVSSLAAVGGGGSVYAAGAADMVGLADRTANATERAAAALETIVADPAKLSAARGAAVSDE